MADVVILGAGVMGSAMAVPAAARGLDVALVGTALDEEIVRSVAGNGHHPRLGLALPASVTAHRWTDLGRTLEAEPDLLVLGVSSAGVPWAIDRLAESLRGPVPILMITKGLAPIGDAIEVLPALVRRELMARRGFDVPVMAVGGPCIAGELAAGRHTNILVTGMDAALVARTAGALSGPFYHAGPSADLVGVEVCAAFKNFFALGVGWASGRLEREGDAANGAVMHNLAANLFAESIAEMEVIVEALGGRRETVAGLAGAGDLYVTCLDGRNSRMGRLLGLGLPYAEAKAGHMALDTVEGAELALALGPTLERMIETGRMDGRRLPLTRAILATIGHGRPMEIDFSAFALR